MSLRIVRTGLAVALLAAAAWLALVVRNAAASPQTVTLGSTTGSTNANICPGGFLCTYVPFTGVSNPTLLVPFDGTVTSFAVNSGSAAGTVELRVLRPAAAGQYTGVGTSAAGTLGLGVNTFTVSLPVKAGDLLALDNSSSALIFDNSQTGPITPYYLPALADGATAAPNYTTLNVRLLLSATVQASATSTTTTTTSTSTTTTTTTTSTATPAQPSAPTISGASLSARRFRVASQPTAISAKAPLGTAFRFTLSASASLRIAIGRSVAGVRRGDRCVAPSAALHRKHAKACRRVLGVGALERATEATGSDRVPFTGRLGSSALRPGEYSAILTASNAAGRSKPVALRFVVVAS